MIIYHESAYINIEGEWVCIIIAMVIIVIIIIVIILTNYIWSATRNELWMCHYSWTGVCYFMLCSHNAEHDVEPVQCSEDAEHDVHAMQCSHGSEHNVAPRYEMQNRCSVHMRQKSCSGHIR